MNELTTQQVTLIIVVTIILYMLCNTLNTKEKFCGCGKVVEGFCGNLFTGKCKPGCPNGMISYAMPGLLTKSRRMSVNLKNIELNNF